MKTTLWVLLAMAILLCACATATTISVVESKWGPPAEIVKNDGTKTYFWYFEEGLYAKTWVTYEFVCDDEGKIISKRKYFKQPKIQK